MNAAGFEQWLMSDHRTPLIMGILNVTPDSFSDGGAYSDVDRAADHALQMIAEGATIIDVGGESTRPGSTRVDADEQIRRTIPVIRRIASSGAIISIDTTSATVAEAALDAGATLLNDISAGREDPRLLELAASRSVPIVLMHMQGDPKTMQVAPVYENVIAEVRSFLEGRRDEAVRVGIEPHRVLLDVGIGFGKSLEHSLTLLKSHATFAGLGHPTVLGVSRKRFIGTLTDKPVPTERTFGTAAANAWGLANGADILRVHDVAATRDVASIISAIRSAT